MAEPTPVDSLIEIFKSALNSDERVRKPAEEQILSLEENNPVDLFDCCSTIVLKYDELVSRAVIKFALIEIVKLLDPNRFGEALFGLWNESLDDSIKECVRLATLRGLLFESDVMTIASVAFAKLFAVDLGNMKAGDNIHYILTNPDQYDESNMCGALTAIAELSSKENRINDEIHNEQLKEEFLKYGEDIIFLMNHITEHSNEFSKALLLAVNNICADCMPLIYEFPFVRQILEIITGLFPVCSDQNLFEELFKIFYNIVEKSYDIPPLHETVSVDNVVQLATQALQVNRGFLTSSLLFWVYLLKFEKDRIEKNRKNSRFCQEYAERAGGKPTYLKLPSEELFIRGFGEKAVEEISERIIQIIMDVDPEDTDPEDLETPDGPMYACCILSRLFYFNPQFIFENTRKIWDSIPNDADEWTVLHFKAIIPYILCTNIPAPLPNIREFAIGSCEFLVSVILNESAIPRLVDSALYSLYVIEKKYENIRTKEQIDSLFGGISIQQGRHEVIALRCLTLVNEIIRKSKYVSEDFNAYLEDPVFETIGNVLGSYSTNDTIIRHAYFTLFNYIKSCSESLIEKIVARLDTVFGDLDTLFGQILDETNQMPQNIQYTLIQTKLWLVSSIFRRFHNHGIEEKANIASDKLIGYMRIPGAENYQEEVLSALFDVILALPPTNTTIKETLMSYCEFTLQSMNCELATAAITALSYLFKKFGESVSDIFNPTLDIVFSLLDADNFNGEKKPDILFALATIIRSLNRSLDGKVEELIQRIYPYITINFRTSSMADLIYINKIYASIYLCFSALLEKIPSDADFINRQFFKNLITPIKKLASLEYVDNETIWAMLDFFNNAMPVFGRKGNIFINWHCNYFICVWGIVSDDKALSDESKRVLKAIKAC